MNRLVGIVLLVVLNLLAQGTVNHGPQVFKPSATAAGARAECAGLPSSPVNGDIACDSADSNQIKVRSNGAWMKAGGSLVGNAQVGTTYTVLTGDRSKTVTFSNAGAIAVTLPQAAAGFEDGWFTLLKNIGAGDVTVTPTTSTISGAATVVISTGESCAVSSNGTNYEAMCGRLLPGTGILLTKSRTSFTVDVDTAIIPTKANLQSGAVLFATTGGTSTVYTLALTPTLAAYAAGQILTAKMHTASGASPTINVDTLGAKKIYKSNGTTAPAQVTTNELQATVYEFRYDAALDAAVGGFIVDIGGGGGGGDVSGGSTSVDGELAAYNGTGGKTIKQSFAAFSGPATSVKTYTLQNASSTIVTSTAVGALLGTGISAVDSPRNGAITYLQEEFLTGRGSAQFEYVGGFGWRLTHNASGPTISPNTAEANHPGILDMSTAAAASDDALIFSHFKFIPSDMWSLRFLVKLSSSASVTAVVGVSDNVFGYSARGVYVIKEAGDSNWFCQVKDTSATKTDMSVAVGTGWVAFQLRRVNGTTVGCKTATTLAGLDGAGETTITTNIPTAALYAVAQIRTDTTAVKTLSLDYIDMLFTGLSR